MLTTSRGRTWGWIAAAVVLSQVFGSVPLLSASGAAVRSSGQTIYVPVYSHIFIGDRAAAFNLAATLSIRNIDPIHSITLIAADYHDASGRFVKKHVQKQLVLGPFASTEAFIPESDTSGGFGASFIVKWKSDQPAVPPVVECVMIGTRSGQGISIVSPGRVIHENTN